MALNAFEQLAKAQISAPVKSRQRAADTRRARTAQAEKELADEAQLLKLYRRHQRKDIRNLLNGPFGKDVRGLITILRTMTLDSGPALIKIVRGSAWLKSMPTNHRWIVLRIIGRAIVRVREKNELEPFDDGLPGEAPKAFEQIKSELGLR